MNYQKEFAILVGQVDRAITILERFAADDLVVKRAGELLVSALQEAEEHYMAHAEAAH